MERTRKWFNAVVVATASSLVVTAPPAAAGLIGTDQAVADSAAGSERERVSALLARPEVAQRLQDLGIAPGDAKARVDALTDQEVHALAARIDQLPAGGNFSDFQWVMILIGVIIIALLV